MSARSIGAVLVLLASITAGVRAQPPQAPAAKPAPDAKPEPETKVVTSEAVRALVLPMKGSYLQHPEAFGRLGAFLASKGIAASSAAFGRYFSDPAQGEQNLQWEVGFPVAAGVAAEAPFEIKELPATLTAVRVHRGSYEDLGAAWPDFIQWMLANGYQPAGPPLQVFLDPITPVIELRMPVQKAK